VVAESAARRREALAGDREVLAMANKFDLEHRLKIEMMGNGGSIVASFDRAFLRSGLGTKIHCGS
jgi:hypothetical protein